MAAALQKKSGKQESLKERVRELIENVVEGLRELVTPPRVMVPIPVSRRRRRR